MPLRTAWTNGLPDDQFSSRSSPVGSPVRRSTAAHAPLVKVAACPDLDTKTLAAYLQAGTAAWADVVDFYSRHDCHRLQFFPGYRRAETALPSLPAAPS